jgi:hypothetical protein
LLPQSVRSVVESHPQMPELLEVGTAALGHSPSMWHVWKHAASTVPSLVPGTLATWPTGGDGPWATPLSPLP